METEIFYLIKGVASGNLVILKEKKDNTVHELTFVQVVKQKTVRASYAPVWNKDVLTFNSCILHTSDDLNEILSYAMTIDL